MQKNIGTHMENIAADFLQKKGLKIYQKNFQSKIGEIDLICLDKKTLVFVEVRFRKHPHFGGALASINHCKQKKIIRTAQYFQLQTPWSQKCPCRFDVVGITKVHLQIDWIQNAFWPVNP